MAEVLTQRLMVAGDYDGHGHVPWPGTPADAIARIIERWTAWGEDFLTPGAIVWLANTPAGEEIGQRVIERETPIYREYMEGRELRKQDVARSS